MAKKKYYATLDRNGTEDEISIRTPEGRELAFIWFWDDADCPHAAAKKVDAEFIVAALNAYRGRKRPSPLAVSPYHQPDEVPAEESPF
jgi:hypothetical protein